MKLRVVKAKSATKRDNSNNVDGGWVVADVISDSDEKVLARGVRVFYFLDSLPGGELDKATAGKELEILGMPRLNMDTILSASEGKQAVTIALPIEFVAVALLSSQ